MLDEFIGLGLYVLAGFRVPHDMPASRRDPFDENMVDFIFSVHEHHDYRIPVERAPFPAGLEFHSKHLDAVLEMQDPWGHMCVSFCGSLLYPAQRIFLFAFFAADTSRFFAALRSLAAISSGSRKRPSSSLHTLRM